MALYDLKTPETAEEQVAQVMRSFISAVGEVPKPLMMLANSPGLFMQQASLIGYFRDHSKLSFALLSCIRYLAAQELGYKACIEFNGNMLKKQGMTDSDLAAMVEDPSTAPLEEHEVALLDFVLRGLKDPDSGDSSQMRKLLEMGWSEADIMDAVQMGFSLMVPGRMMRYFQIEA